MSALITPVKFLAASLQNTATFQHYDPSFSKPKHGFSHHFQANSFVSLFSHDQDSALEIWWGGLLRLTNSNTENFAHLFTILSHSFCCQKCHL